MSVLPSLDLLDSPAEAAAVRRLPFAFAKRHGVLLQAGRVVYRPGAALMAVAVAEALRFARLKGKDLSRSKLESINKSVPFSQSPFPKGCKVTAFKQVSNRDASSYFKDYLVRYADNLDIKDFVEIVKSIAED